MCQCGKSKFVVDMTFNVWQSRENWLNAVLGKYGPEVANICAKIIGDVKLAPKNPSEVIKQALKDVTS